MPPGSGIRTMRCLGIPVAMRRTAGKTGRVKRIYDGLMASLLLTTAALVSGCATSQMMVPPDVVQGTDVLQVTDRSRMSGVLVNEGFRLGDAQISGVSRGGEAGSGLRTGFFKSEEYSGGYSYRYTRGALQLEGACATKSVSESVELGAGVKMSAGAGGLACRCGDAEIAMAGRRGKSYEGAMVVGGRSLAVVSLHETESGGYSREPTGYRVDGAGVTGAVEVLHPGRVWLDRGLSEEDRGKVSCLFVGMMLYKPPKKS